jgi:hypothetical protein
MEKSKESVNQSNPAKSERNEQKLALLSLRLTREQREKLTRLGGTAWLRRQIDAAVLPGEDKQQNHQADQCQCKNSQGIQCARPAAFELNQVIDGARHLFKVCQQHHKAFQHGTLAVGDKRKVS